jgi:hypothetical protein
MLGYNAQAVADENQIVIAAEVNADSPDFGHLEPMVNAAQIELEDAGVTEKPEIVVADAGYWHQKQMENVIDKGIQVLIPPDAGKRKDTRPGVAGRPVLVDALCAGDLPRPRCLSKTAGDDRAGVRQHKVQPAVRSLPTPRPRRGALAVAPDHSDAQPA